MDSFFNFERSECDDYYNILGCDELSTLEQIIAEYKTRVLSCHPDKCHGDIEAENRFVKLQCAKEVLTNEESRKDYDAWRKSDIALSFDEWQARKDSIKMSMHWANKSKKEPMIESAERTPVGTCASSQDMIAPDYLPGYEPKGFQTFSTSELENLGIPITTQQWKRADDPALQHFRSYSQC